MKSSLFLFFIWTASLFCQVPQWEWASKAEGVFEFHESLGHTSALLGDRFGNVFVHTGNGKSCKISKYAKTGLQLWSKEFPEFIVDLAIDPDGNLYVSGRSSRLAFYQDTAPRLAILMKCDPDGNIIWRNEYLGVHCSIVALEYSKGEIVIGGYYSDSLKFQSQTLKPGGGFVAKLDAQGSEKWIYTTDTLVGIEYLSCNASGEIFAAFQYGIIKFSADGNPLLKVSLGDEAHGICLDDSSNVFVVLNTGFYSPGNYPLLQKFSSTLQHRWTTKIGHPHQGGPYNFWSKPVFNKPNHVLVGGEIRPHSDIIIIGPDTIDWKGQLDIALTTINTYDGTFYKTYTAGGHGYEHVEDICVDVLGNAYVSGYFYDTLCFPAKCLTAHGQSAFVAKLKLSNQEFNDAVGISSLSTKEIMIYPNPNQGSIKIAYSAQEIVDRVIITDLLGVSKQVHLSSGNQIDLSELPDGFYTITFNLSQKRYSSKIIIEH